MALYYKSKYTGEKIEELLDKAESITANPNDNPTAELVKIKIGDRTFSIPVGGLNILDLNKILDPDNYPIDTDPDYSEFDYDLEVGKLNRNTGEERDGEGGLRTPEFIPIEDYKFVKPLFDTTSDGISEICMLAYKSDYSYANWYGYIDSNESYNLVENGLPADAVYLKGYISTEDTECYMTLTFTYTKDGSIKAEHKKIYFADHGYSVYGADIDDATMHKLVIKSDGADGNTYNITEIKAPTQNPEEATLALMNWGNGRKQFVDFSSMTYDPEKPTVEIVCQTRDGEPLPEFSIRYNNGFGNGRVRKFTVQPDAIPIELTSKGLKVRRNNDYNNDKNEEDYATINLFELAQKLNNSYQIKKVEFTDRPSLFAWLQNNVDKVVKASLITNQFPAPINFTQVIAVLGSEDVHYELQQLHGWFSSQGELELSIFEIKQNQTEQRAGHVGMGDYMTNIIPDEYWSVLGVSVTMYYLS